MDKMKVVFQALDQELTQANLDLSLSVLVVLYLIPWS